MKDCTICSKEFEIGETVYRIEQLEYTGSTFKNPKGLETMCFDCWNSFQF